VATYTQDYLVFTPEVWSPRIDMFFRRKLAAASFFDNYSNEVARGGDTIHIPIISSNFTAAAVTSTSGDCAIMNVNDTSTTIVLSTWQNANQTITDLQKAQIATQYRLKEGYAIAMGHALATKLDTDLLALATNLDPVVGDSATDVQATTLEEAINIMESYSVPLDECLFVFHPNAYLPMCLLWETIISKLSKLRENLKEAIRSEAQKWERSTTIMGAPQMVMG